jgi:hypothetical protein
VSDDRPPIPPPSSEEPRPRREVTSPFSEAATQRAERRRMPRGLSLLAVLPADLDDPVWDPVDPKLGARLVLHEDVAALVAPAPPAGADSDALHVTARHWEVHRALLAGDVIPAPCGAVFADDAEVLAFLEASYTALRSALARVRGRWEFRLHVGLAEPGFSETRALDLATHIYAELRRLARAAVPFPRENPRVLSAAFLVERAASETFRDRVDQLSALNTALDLDLTGPWPPYDFVAMVPPPPVEPAVPAAVPHARPVDAHH